MNDGTVDLPPPRPSATHEPASSHASRADVGAFSPSASFVAADAKIISGRRHDGAAVGQFDDNVSTVATRIATTRPLLLLPPGEAIALPLPKSNANVQSSTHVSTLLRTRDWQTSTLSGTTTLFP